MTRARRGSRGHCFRQAHLSCDNDRKPVMKPRSAMSAEQVRGAMSVERDRCRWRMDGARDAVGVLDVDGVGDAQSESSLQVDRPKVASERPVVLLPPLPLLR